MPDTLAPAPSTTLKATLLSASGLRMIAVLAIAPAVPAMKDFFSATYTSALPVNLAVVMPALFIVIGSPLAGWVVDRLGRKALLVVCATLFGLSGASIYLLDSLPAVLTARAFQGLAIAGVMTSVTTLIADYFEGKARAKFMGWQSASMAFFGVAALVAGGALADITWQTPFLLYTVAFAMVPFIVLSVYEPPRKAPEVATDGASSETLWTPQLRRVLALLYGLIFVEMMVLYLVPVQSPHFIRQLTNASGLNIGMVVATITLSTAFVSLTYGRLIHGRLSERGAVAVAFTAFGLGFLIIGSADGYPGVIGGLALAGIGPGIMTPHLNVWLMHVTPLPIRGRALGGLITCLYLGQFVSPIAAEPIIQQAGYGGAFTAGGGLLLTVALGFAVWAGLKRGQPEAP